MQTETKRTGVAMLISDKIDFKSKIVLIAKDEHYTLKKGPIHQEDTTI